MREIKFRAWDYDTQRMIFENDIVFHDGTAYASKRDYKDCISIDMELMQYTGLKDKNGKEIYEGDIVLADNRGHNESRLHYIIEYDSTNTCFFGNVDNLVHNKYKNADHHQPMCDIRQNIEVIGNIYENKELLQ